jgi:hypothetical protein
MNQYPTVKYFENQFIGRRNIRKDQKKARDSYDKIPEWD